MMKSWPFGLRLIASRIAVSSSASDAPERSTFLIDKNGKVAKVWRKVSVTGHAADVMQAAAGLG